MKIILNIATHGDEKIGFRVAEEIEKLNIDKNTLSVQIANKKAFELHQRFIDQDLNRSFPGKEIGNHEERLAFELSPIIKSADLVIDIHSTTSELKDAIIVTKLDDKTLKYIKVIQPKYVLIMNATKDIALVSQAKIGIAFEYGKDDDQEALRKMVIDIKRLFNYLGLITIKLPKKTNKMTNYFDVVSTVAKPDGFSLLKGIKNYNIIHRGRVYASNGEKHLLAEEDFYPILFGEKKYKDFFGFKGRKIVIK